MVTRRRQKASSSVQQVLVKKPDVRDQIRQLGIYKGNRQCQPPRRLVELFVKRLRSVEVVALYDARWSVETSLVLVKRRLDLASLCDDGANQLDLTLEKISVEMV